MPRTKMSAMTGTAELNATIERITPTSSGCSRTARLAPRL